MSNIILITGASSDIGLQLIRSIKEECLILAHYNNSITELTELSRQITNKLIPIQADLSSETDVYKLLDTIEQNYGIPNKIVHLAAPKFENIRFKNVDLKKFENDIFISLKSIIIILNRFLPTLATQKKGKVVFMLSSVTLNVPPKALVQYTIVKYALLGLMKSLASEYADKHININAISPSMIETKFLSQIHEKFIELAADNNPLKRNGTVNDVIPTLLLLLSDESSYINGVNIPITGGSIF